MGTAVPEPRFSFYNQIPYFRSQTDIGNCKIVHRINGMPEFRKRLSVLYCAIRPSIFADVDGRQVSKPQHIDKKLFF